MGFWKDGRQDGYGKYFKGDKIKYGNWNKGKREKWINEEEFLNGFGEKNEFAHIFRWDINKLRQFMEINETEDESGNESREYDNETIKEFQRKKNDQSEEEEDEED